MASFSSRGPNFRAPEVLKPDVTAPGVHILAAWTGANSPTSLASDTRRAQYNIVWGTSMSCPHVSGVAAMLRQARPEWRPAAIKSALMTTAYNMDIAGRVIGDMSTGDVSTPFVRGAGHIDPNRAMNPGLVYDAGTEDYVDFLCALGYTAEQVAVFSSSANCSARAGSSVGDHNYSRHAAPRRAQPRWRRPGYVQSQGHCSGRRARHGDPPDSAVQRETKDTEVRGHLRTAYLRERHQESHVRFDRVERSQTLGNEPYRRYLAPVSQVAEM